VLYWNPIPAAISRVTVHPAATVTEEAMWLPQDREDAEHDTLLPPGSVNGTVMV